jgi:rubrerythrin
MDDCISREAAINEQKRFCGYLDNDMLNRLEIAMRRIPAADVRPVARGRWIDTDNYYQRWKCSVCGCHTRDARPPFCPNCGADMREES